MDEIRNITDALGGYTDEVIREIYNQSKMNPELKKEEIITAIAIASENMKADALWFRLKGIEDALQQIACMIPYKEN